MLIPSWKVLVIRVFLVNHMDNRSNPGKLLNIYVFWASPENHQDTRQTGYLLLLCICIQYTFFKHVQTSLTVWYQRKYSLKIIILLLEKYWNIPRIISYLKSANPYPYKEANRSCSQISILKFFPSSDSNFGSLRHHLYMLFSSITEIHN